MLAIHTGLGLAAGQALVMTAPVEALPLARRITEQAYRAGCPLVTTTLARYRLGTDARFDTAPGWLFDGMAQAFHAGAARLPRRCGRPGRRLGRT